MQTISNIPADFHLVRHFSAIYSQYSEPMDRWPAEVDAPFEIRRHWQDRAHAEAVLRRFLALYKLETIEKPSGA